MDFIKYEIGDSGTHPLSGLRVLVQLKRLNPVTKTPWMVYCTFSNSVFYSLLYKKTLAPSLVDCWAYAPKEITNVRRNG